MSVTMPLVENPNAPPVATEDEIADGLRVVGFNLVCHRCGIVATADTHIEVEARTRHHWRVTAHEGEWHGIATQRVFERQKP